jgi:hypothetical protein
MNGNIPAVTPTTSMSNIGRLFRQKGGTEYDTANMKYVAIKGVIETSITDVNRKPATNRKRTRYFAFLIDNFPEDMGKILFRGFSLSLSLSIS